MKSISITTIAAAIAFVGGMAVLPASPALAQSGSRLCGKIATTPTGAMAILYEAREKETSYSEECQKAEEKAAASIQANPKLNQLQWANLHKEVCESVSDRLTEKTVHDICDYMEARTGYLVTYTKSTKATSYEKQ